MMKNREFQELVDRNLSGLVWDQRQRNRVLREIDKEEKPVKKFSVSVVAIALILCISVPALAAGLIFSQKVDAALAADRALEASYGITDEMQVYFHREVQEMPDGSAIVTYQGNWDMHYVLGDYTVIVQDGKATAAWSHDGKDTSGGFDAHAWGADQLSEIIRLYKEEHNFAEAYRKAEAIAAANGTTAEPLGGMYYAEGDWDELQLTLQEKSKLTIEEMTALAKEAVQIVYGLSDAQMAKLEYNPYLSSFNEADDVVCYTVCLCLVQEPATESLEYPAYTEGDGDYVVVVNAETGVIESLEYEAALAGNG